MACGAHGEGVVLFDISDPIHPERLSHFANPLVTTHHSTTFSNEGRTLVLDDEVYTGVCVGGTQEKTGVLWFYDISDPTDPIESGWFQLPRPVFEVDLPVFSKAISLPHMDAQTQ